MSDKLAFFEFVSDVRSGVYPEQRCEVGIEPNELRRFIESLPPV
jgi:hypothetical protein